MPTKTKPIIPNSRDFVGEAIQANIRKADAEREAARAMLAALEMIETCLRPEDNDRAARVVRAAIAAAKAAGIKAEG